MSHESYFLPVILSNRTDCQRTLLEKRFIQRRQARHLSYTFDANDTRTDMSRKRSSIFFGQEVNTKSKGVDGQHVGSLSQAGSPVKTLSRQRM